MDGTGRDISGERRIVTALFSDVVGSTTIAEGLDPEDWGELVRGAIDTMGTVVSRFGGTVTEFAGDGIVALFGAPIAHEDDPYRAVSAGLSIVEAMRRQEGQLEVRVGIHTGLVVVGDVSAGDRSSYSALGDTLNVASRLQEIAETGTVVMSSETRRLLSSEVDAVSLGPADLKGRKEPVDVYLAQAVHPVEHRRRGLPGINSPMVGRSEELTTLENLAALSRAGTGRVAAILGDPGVGKSRLFGELGAGLSGNEAIVWAVGTCVAFDDEVPYHLAASLLRSLAGIGPSESPETATAAVETLARDVGLRELAPSLVRLLGLSDEEEPADPDLVQREFSHALTSLVSAVSRANRLVVLVCEDAHWADASSVEVVMDVMTRVPSLPVLMLIVMRPDRSTPGWALLEQARRTLAESLTEIQIGPLGESDSRALVSNLLEVESLPPTLRRLVLDKAEGNPFFLEEVIRMLIDGELVENRGGRWIGREQIGDLEVPETIEGLVASRIDMIGPYLRRAGRVASVIGRRFTARIFDEVYGTRPDEEKGGLHPHLAELESHGLIRVEEIEPELEFSFRHALIHDVMYRGLLRRERRVLHGLVAESIERVYSERLQELAPSLARHYAEAGIADKAISYLFTAGRQAQARGARVEAERFFARAQALLEAEPDAEPADLVDAVIGRLTAGMAFTPGQEAIEIIESAMPIAEELDDPERLAKLYERLIWTLSLQGETYANPGFRKRLETGYALVARVTDRGTEALLHAMMGGALRSGDEYQEAVKPLSKAVDRLEEVSRLREASYNAAMLADSLSHLGRFDEAIEAVERARDLGERSGDPNALLDADIIHGSIAADRGDLEEALFYTRRGIDGAEAHGNTFCNLAGNFKLADQQLRLGDVESAITHLERSTGLAQYCDAGGYEALGQAWLVQARSRTGDLRPGEFDKPLASAVESGSRSMEGLIRLRRAIAFAGSGDHERAQPDFERAIELFADYGGVPNLGRAHHAYGQALEAAGRPEEAVPHLREAEQIFEDLGIRPDPVEAK